MKKFLFTLIFILLGANLAIFYSLSFAHEGKLKVILLDVGQGDAIFIETPSGNQVLIDGGPDTSVVRELGAVMPFGDKTLDMVMLTHGDKDHVGGLPGVLERYTVGHIVTTGFDGDSQTYKAFENLSEGEQAILIQAKREQVIDLGDGVLLTILYPDISAISRKLNDTSIIARLDYEETSMLFTGDIEADVEEYLLSLDSESDILDVDILKVAHHGSKSSSIEAFLKEVTPEVAVIQVGKDNTYGHPHEETLQSLGEYTKDIYMTSKLKNSAFDIEDIQFVVR